MNHFDFFAEWNKVVKPQDGNYWEDNSFYYRLGENNEMQVAIRELSDRWANSGDAVFSIPKTYRGFNILRQNLAAFARVVALISAPAMKRRFLPTTEPLRRISTRRIEIPPVRDRETAARYSRISNSVKGTQHGQDFNPG